MTRVGRGETVRRMNTKILYFFLGALLYGCAPDSALRKEAIEIDLNNTSSCILESEMVDSVTYLQLETSDECLLGNIKSIAVLDSLFICLDDKSDAVLSFDCSGKFRSPFGGRGEGPEEYIEATQIDVSPTTGEVYVYDRMGCKVLCYNADGRYLRTIPTLGYAYDFAFWEENGDRGFIFVNNNGKDETAGITRHDLNTGEIKRLVARPTGFRSNARNEFCHSNGQLFVAAPPFDNEIYEVSGDSITQVFALDILPAPTQSDIEYAYTRPSMESFMRFYYYKTSRWLFVSFWSGVNGSRDCLLDLKSGEYSVSETMKNDISGDVYDVLPICVDDVAIGLAHPENADDNPRLAFLHYKK